MNWLVVQIASGRVFFVAVALLIAAVGLRSSVAPRQWRGATWCLVVGLIGLSVSATPLPTWAYAVILLSIVVGWGESVRRECRDGHRHECPRSPRSRAP